MSEMVNVCRLDFEGQVCIYGDIDAALEEVRLFWTEDGPQMGTKLTLTFDEMPKEEFDALEEHAGW